MDACAEVSARGCLHEDACTRALAHMLVWRVQGASCMNVLAWGCLRGHARTGVACMYMEVHTNMCMHEKNAKACADKLA